MNHEKQAQYPIIDSEFNTRFFDKELIAAIVYSDKEYFADPAMKKYIDKDNEKPMDWENMSILEQIHAQIGFVAPPPRGNIEDEMDSDDKWADKVCKEIEAINA